MWGPAWVYWRWGGGYVGWAPMAPRGVDHRAAARRALAVALHRRAISSARAVRTFCRRTRCRRCGARTTRESPTSRSVNVRGTRRCASTPARRASRRRGDGARDPPTPLRRCAPRALPQPGDRAARRRAAAARGRGCSAARRVGGDVRAHAATLAGVASRSARAAESPIARAAARLSRAAARCSRIAAACRCTYARAVRAQPMLRAAVRTRATSQPYHTAPPQRIATRAGAVVPPRAGSYHYHGAGAVVSPAPRVLQRADASRTTRARRITPRVARRSTQPRRCTQRAGAALPRRPRVGGGFHSAAVAAASTAVGRRWHGRLVGAGEATLPPVAVRVPPTPQPLHG